MIRNHHDITQLNSLRQNLNIDEMQRDVEQMLTEIQKIDEEFTIRYKSRQFFSTSNVVSNQNDDVTHFLNIKIVRQLKY